MRNGLDISVLPNEDVIIGTEFVTVNYTDVSLLINHRNYHPHYLPHVMAPSSFNVCLVINFFLESAECRLMQIFECNFPGNLFTC